MLTGKPFDSITAMKAVKQAIYLASHGSDDSIKQHIEWQLTLGKPIGKATPGQGDARERRKLLIGDSSKFTTDKIKKIIPFGKKDKPILDENLRGTKSCPKLDFKVATHD